MPDGHEQQVNTEVDGHIAVARAVNTVSRFIPLGPSAGYTAGGGGEGGHFAISSLEELDALISRWRGILDRIDSSAHKLDMALQRVNPPAEDAPSQFEATETKKSLQEAIKHNAAMGQYAKAYIDKLTAARKDYAGTESDNAATIDKSGG